MESTERKALGAFYTDQQVADFLVWWAVRSSRETVLDPCFGGGVFLHSACRRLSSLGGRPSEQVYGIEIDGGAHAPVLLALENDHGLNRTNLLQLDFFDVDVGGIPAPDVVVGNPPFIRYQRFNGSGRAKAKYRARAQGVFLSNLASSWAPFLVHCIALLKPGGRLAMVIPAEIGHASYAAPVVEYLFRSFGSVTLLTFKKRLFSQLSQDTVLLLAEGRGESCAAALWQDFAHAGLLKQVMESGNRPMSGTQRLDREAFLSGRLRLVHKYLPPRALDLYRELERSGNVARLGDIADVGIGYVTGANDFFHLNHETVCEYKIPEAFLRPAVRRGRDLVGLRFTIDDWQALVSKGHGVYLLSINPGAGLPDGVRDYVRMGERLGIHQGYKCRVRSPWYAVPNVYRGDAFLSYMSGASPRLVSNEARAVAPNSLHVVRLHPWVSGSAPALAALWQTSLARLSSEIEGHSMGGGMLKLEPGEAENVLVPAWKGNVAEVEALGDVLDGLYRSGLHAEALERADTEILGKGLGLTDDDIALLRSACETLQVRRCRKG